MASTSDTRLMQIPPQMAVRAVGIEPGVVAASLAHNNISSIANAQTTAMLRDCGFDDPIGVLADAFPTIADGTSPLVAYTSERSATHIVDNDIMPIVREKLQSGENVYRSIYIKIQRQINVFGADEFSIYTNRLELDNESSKDNEKQKKYDGTTIEGTSLTCVSQKQMSMLYAHVVNGGSVFFAPVSNKFHYIPVDDVDAELFDIFAPNVVMQSSLYKKQAIYFIPKTIEKHVCDEITIFLNRFFGDKSVQSTEHDTRLAGFKNGKYKEDLTKIGNKRACEFAATVSSPCSCIIDDAFAGFVRLFNATYQAMFVDIVTLKSISSLAVENVPVAIPPRTRIAAGYMRARRKWAETRMQECGLGDFLVWTSGAPERFAAAYNDAQMTPNIATQEMVRQETLQGNRQTSQPPEVVTLETVRQERTIAPMQGHVVVADYATHAEVTFPAEFLSLVDKAKNDAIVEYRRLAGTKGHTQIPADGVEYDRSAADWRICMAVMNTIADAWRKNYDIGDMRNWPVYLCQWGAENFTKCDGRDVPRIHDDGTPYLKKNSPKTAEQKAKYAKLTVDAAVQAFASKEPELYAVLSSSTTAAAPVSQTQNMTAEPVGQMIEENSVLPVVSEDETRCPSS